MYIMSDKTYINVRQLLRDVTEATKTLPVVVTRYGRPIFKIIAVDGKETEKPIPESLGVCSWDKAYKCTSPAVIKVGGKGFCLRHSTDS